MRIISKKKLREFWESPAGALAKAQLEAWYHVVKHAKWECFADAKATYGKSLDQVGDCAVFNIHGNRFRLITRLRFQSDRVYVLKVMPHKEYDKDKWKTECGCFAEPPAMKRQVDSRASTLEVEAEVRPRRRK